MELSIEFKDRMREMLGDEYPEFEKAFEEGENFQAIRVNSLKKIPENLKNIILGLEKVPWCPGGYYITKDILDGKSPEHMAGLIYFQEPSAMSVVPVLGIEKGDFVLDLCAAPGGKSTHAAEFLSGEGLLVSNEIVKKRSTILSDNLERMGIKNAIVTNENPKDLEDKFPEFFNKIIVDAPCSGEGMFRKEEKAIEEWSLEHTKSCAVRQKLIMDSAIKMLSPGGKLVYSTCTFSPLENEGVADYVLSNYPEMELLPIDTPYFSDGFNLDFTHDLTKTKRIFPHKNKGEGHFIALFKKKGEYSKPQLKCGKIPDISLYREFEKKYLDCSLSGQFLTFGEDLYFSEINVDISNIKVIRYGLHLGKLKKGRFEPSHALALSLDCQKFKFECPDINKYFRGETFLSDIDGWCVVTHNGMNMGWSKGSGGVLKNHFPKYMRF